MKTDLYSKIMLTIIAGCLITIVVQQSRSKPVEIPEMPKPVGPMPVTIEDMTSRTSLGIGLSRALNVRIVGVASRVSFPVEIGAESLDVNINTIGGRSFQSDMGLEAALPVQILPRK